MRGMLSFKDKKGEWVKVGEVESELSIHEPKESDENSQKPLHLQWLGGGVDFTVAFPAQAVGIECTFKGVPFQMLWNPFSGDTFIKGRDGIPPEFIMALLLGSTSGKSWRLSLSMLENIALIDFSGCDLSGSTFDMCNFTSCDFTNATLIGVTFDHCDLSLCKWEEANIEGATFKDCYPYWAIGDLRAVAKNADKAVFL